MLMRAPASTIQCGPQRSISRGQPEGLKAEWMRLKWIELVGEITRTSMAAPCPCPSLLSHNLWRYPLGKADPAREAKACKENEAQTNDQSRLENVVNQPANPKLSEPN